MPNQQRLDTEVHTSAFVSGAVFRVSVFTQVHASSTLSLIIVAPSLGNSYVLDMVKNFFYPFSPQNR